MKTKRFFIVCVSLFMGSQAILFAQDKREGRPERKQLTKEQMQEMQCNRIIGVLALDDATAAQFAPVYKNYLDEISALRDEMKPNRPEGEGQMNELPEPKAAPTDAEVEEAMKARFAQGRKMLDVSEKYYEEFRKFLSPKQIQRIYDMGMNPGGKAPQGMKKGPGKNPRRGGDWQPVPQPPFHGNEGRME